MLCNILTNPKNLIQLPYMRILSIETSCDETAVSILEASGGTENPTYRILGNALYSQIDIHTPYGGVFPILAKREHAKNLVPLLASASDISIEKLSTEGVTYDSTIPEITESVREELKNLLSREEGLFDAFMEFLDTHELLSVDCIAVTEGPGLEPALWVGVSFAKALAIVLQKPLVPVNHMEGHIVSVLMSEAHELKESVVPNVEFPALALLISGGHTELVHASKWHTYKIIGQTVDDAVGEAFDKVARLLRLAYPGGPKISKLAAESRLQNLREKHKKETGAYPWILPRPMIHSKDFNFSFSGLKTAVLYAVQKKLKETEATELTEIQKMTLAEEFENAVTEVIVSKTKAALEETGAKTFIVGGGVIANTYMRNSLTELISGNFPDTKLLIPTIDLTTDNSVMIGIAGYLRFVSKDSRILEPDEVMSLTAKGNLSL